MMVDQHAIVGSWRVSVHIPGLDAPFVNLARLSADGGVVTAFPSPTPAAPNSGTSSNSGPRPSASGKRGLTGRCG